MKKLLSMEPCNIVEIHTDPNRMEEEQWMFYERHPQIKLDYLPSVFEVTEGTDPYTNYVEWDVPEVDGFFSILENKAMNGHQESRDALGVVETEDWSMGEPCTYKKKLAPVEP
jgi:hypothetical protein